MEDRILISTSALEHMSSQVRQVEEELSSITSKLNNAMLDMQRVAYSQKETINRLSRAQSNLKSCITYTGRLSKSMRQAAQQWDNTEHELATTQMDTNAGSFVENAAGIGGAIGAAAAFSFQGDQPAPVYSEQERQDAVIEMLHYPKDQSLWSDDMRATYNETMQGLEQGWTDDGTPVLFSGDKAIIMEDGAVAIFSVKTTTIGETKTRTLQHEDGSYSKFETKTADLYVGGKGKIKDDSLKRPTIGKPKKEQYGGKTKAERVAEFATVSLVEGSAEYAAYHRERSVENGAYSGNVSVSMGEAKGEYSVKAGIWGTSVDKNGNVSYHLEPGAEVKIGGSCSIVTANVDGQIGSDNLNLHASGEATLGRASAEGEATIGWIDGKFSAHAEAKLEVIAAEIKGTAGVNVGGVEANVTATANVGFGAHADVGWHDGTLTVDIGASFGVGGSIKFDVNVDGLVDNVKQGISTVAEGISDGIDKVADGIGNFARGVSKFLFG